MRNAECQNAKCAKCLLHSGIRHSALTSSQCQRRASAYWYACGIVPARICSASFNRRARWVGDSSADFSRNVATVSRSPSRSRYSTSRPRSPAVSRGVFGRGSHGAPHVFDGAATIAVPQSENAEDDIGSVDGRTVLRCRHVAARECGAHLPRTCRARSQPAFALRRASAFWSSGLSRAVNSIHSARMYADSAAEGR